LLYTKKVIFLRRSKKQNINDMKWNELRRIAEKKGWYLWRNGGNHDLYRHPEKGGVLVIERHESQEIRPGLYYELKRQIGF